MLGNKIVQSKPATQRVADYVRGVIRERGLSTGALLPTYAELCERLNLSYVTVKRGMDILQREGLIRRIPSKGSFLTKDLAFRARKLTKIGLISGVPRVELFERSYLREIICGIMLEAELGGRDLHIFSLNSDGMVSAASIETSGVEGLLLLSTENDDYLRSLSGWGIPTVVVDYFSPAIPLEFVTCDHGAGVRCACKYLLDRGHRNIGYVDVEGTQTVEYSGDPRPTLLVRQSSAVVERLAAFREATSAALEGGGEICGEVFPSSGCRMQPVIESWKSGGRKQTAFLTYDVDIALTLMEALHEAGIRVPEDVSVCAVAGAGDAVCGGHPITYCRFDFVAMGRQSVSLLADRCLKPGVNAAHAYRVGFSFVEGVTVKPLA